MKKENFITILSWMLFIPVAIISTIIAVRLLGYFNDFSMWRLGYSSTSLFSKFYMPISNGLANGCVLFILVHSLYLDTRSMLLFY